MNEIIQMGLINMNTIVYFFLWAMLRFCLGFWPHDIIALVVVDFSLLLLLLFKSMKPIKKIN